MPYYGGNLPTPRRYDPMTSGEYADRADTLDQFGLGDTFLGDATDAMGEFALARESLRSMPKRALGDALGLGKDKTGKADLLGRANAGKTTDELSGC